MNKLGIDEGLLMDIMRILIAILCGGIIGIEREVEARMETP